MEEKLEKINTLISLGFEKTSDSNLNNIKLSFGGVNSSQIEVVVH